MTIRKCDVCKKEIKDNKLIISAGFGWSGYEFCSKCGLPVAKFLRKLKLNKNDPGEK